MLRTIFFSVYFAAISKAAFVRAESCTATSDLSVNLGAVYNQGDDLNSCFANTAADQLTQKMLKAGSLAPGERIHPLALWALYILDDRRVPNDSKAVLSTPVNVYSSLWSLKNKNLNMLCRETDFARAADGTNPLFSEAEVAAMNKFKDQLQGPSERPCRLSEANSLMRQSLEIKNASYFHWWETLKKECRTPVPAMNWEWYWQRDRSHSLQEDKIRRRTPFENKPLADKIDEALNAGSIAGIEYQAGFLLASKKKFIHWSNIVERKPSGGKCYYRIRDSFGSDCRRYKNPDQCKDGYLWVEKQELLNHVDAVTYLR